MIVGSLLLILVAVVLLGVGLARGSNTLLIGSIAASLFAAIALVVGARQAVASRVGERDEFDEALGPEPDGEDDDRGPATDPARVPVAAGRTAGARYADGARFETGPAEPPPGPPVAADPPAERRGGRSTSAAPVTEPEIPAQVQAEFDELDDEDPPDEPAPQLISAADAARVARMAIEVLVIDGRPRYHLAGCVHLLGRENEPLPVGEAVELGFTPCSLCEPDSAILAEARRV